MFTPDERSIDQLNNSMSEIDNLNDLLDGVVWDSKIECLREAYNDWSDVKRYISDLIDEISDLQTELEDLKATIEMEIGTDHG